jgi:SET domain-containing protein
VSSKHDHTSAAARRRGPRFVRRRSSIHGFGIFAVRTIPPGTRLIEYKGTLIDSAQADGRYPEVDTPPHTFLFDAEDDLYIDAGVNGNSARWINHSCDPNCESVQEGRRVFIESIRTIRPGEELAYDYRIVIDGPHDSQAKKKWICLCGAKNCRGTMLAPRR